MTDIFLEMSETINLVGENKVINLLQKARENVCNPIHIKKIFEIVCEVFEINIKHIDELKKRTDDRLLIISFCTFYAKKKIKGCSYDDVKNGLSIDLTDRSFISYSNNISKANLKNPKSDIDKKISKHTKQINERINEYFKTKK